MLHHLADGPDSMIRTVVREIRTYLPRRAYFAVLFVVVASLATGVLESAVLVLIVSVAANLDGTGAGGVGGVELPLLGGFDLSDGDAIALAFGCAVALIALRTTNFWMMTRIAARVVQGVRDRVIRAYSDASTARQESEREGALQETAGGLAIQTATLANTLANATSAALSLSVFLVAAIAVDPVTTGTVVLVGILLLVPLRPLSAATRRAGRRFVQANVGFNERITQWGSLSLEHRIFGAEAGQVRALERRNRAVSAEYRRSRFIARIGSSAYRDVALLGLVAAVGVLASLDDVELVSIGSVIILMVRALSYAQVLNGAIQTINETGGNVELLTTRLRSLDDAAVRTGHRSVDRLGTIRFDSVGYDYEPGRPGVRGLDLEIGEREVVGVVGPSGGGKSTLAQVLLRLRPPTSGAVMVDGVPYEEIGADSWHRLTSFVPQDPRLFEGTVADNIRFHRDIDQDQIRRAAEAAHVADDIGRLPDGYDTELGPRGSGLSGGQRQRVAIARALVASPQLLVLDEPTSALDVRSEQLLQQTINDLKGTMTLVIVAHRLTTLEACDRVIAMRDGSIVTIGTLGEALAQVSLDGLADS